MTETPNYQLPLFEETEITEWGNKMNTLDSIPEIIETVNDVIKQLSRQNCEIYPTIK